MSDLKTVFDNIKAKHHRLTELDDYYEGRHPAVALASKMREIFYPLDPKFSANWAAVVISACDERINLTGFEAKDQRAADLLKAAWDRNSLALEAADIHTDAQTLGSCFAIAWPGEDGRADVFYNDPRLMHIQYSGSNPRVALYAGKLFQGDDGLAKLTLYYPDRLEYYTSKVKFDQVSEASAFEPDVSISGGIAPNPYGKVPIFHFRISRNGDSDLVNVIPLQNGVNVLLSDMMVAAKFGAYSQKWIISSTDTSGVKNTPGEILDLPAGDGTGQETQVGQFASADLKNYLDALDRLSTTIGTITRTPKHYFYSQAGDPSGEALIALEAPLNKKAQDRIDRFTPVWRNLAAFICQIEGVTVDPTTITPVFQKPETVQPRTQAEITKIRTESGTPLETALLWEGKTQTEIDAMNKILETEKQAAETSVANALLEAERRAKTQPMPQGMTQPKNGVNQNA